jgi:hypothetical protein
MNNLWYPASMVVDRDRYSPYPVSITGLATMHVIFVRTMRLGAVRKWRMNRTENGFVDRMEGEREGDGV